MSCFNLQLVWLAIPREALDWIHEASFDLIFLRCCSDECKLDIRVKVLAHVSERKLELLNSCCLLDCKRHDLLIGCLIQKLSLTLDNWVVEIAEEEDFDLLAHWLFLENNPVLLMVDHLLHV